MPASGMLTGMSGNERRSFASVLGVGLLVSVTIHEPAGLFLVALMALAGALRWGAGASNFFAHVATGGSIGITLATLHLLAASHRQHVSLKSLLLYSLVYIALSMAGGGAVYSIQPQPWLRRAWVAWPMAVTAALGTFACAFILLVLFWSAAFAIPD